jgi:hypothetical protein
MPRLKLGVVIEAGSAVRPDGRRIDAEPLVNAANDPRLLRDVMGTHGGDHGNQHTGGEARCEIAERQAFVAWWHTNVTPGESPGDNQYRSVTKRVPTISAAEATAQTGISKQQNIGRNLG